MPRSIPWLIIQERFQAPLRLTDCYNAAETSTVIPISTNTYYQSFSLRVILNIALGKNKRDTFFTLSLCNSSACDKRDLSRASSTIVAEAALYVVRECRKYATFGCKGHCCTRKGPSCKEFSQLQLSARLKQACRMRSANRSTEGQHYTCLIVMIIVCYHFVTWFA